jgi:hypothetical protein
VAPSAQRGGGQARVMGPEERNEEGVGPDWRKGILEIELFKNFGD